MPRESCYLDLHWWIGHNWSFELQVCSHWGTWASPNTILGRKPIMTYIKWHMITMNTQSFPKISIYI